MTLLRGFLFPLTLILCAGALLAACTGAGPTESPAAAPTVESFESFEAYSAALSALIREYGLTDGTGENTPYRTRRILITTADELPPCPSAARILRWGDDYVLQFRSAEETWEAFEALKAASLSGSVELDAVLDLDD